ncbi:uncharacterized protein RCC_11160 [Ramularia collo-cygni]|uniref:Uncharacterized protein n=1 Tax=Ramularia collo-cygni TaxID=112498 RepID=A0A2D3VSA4_9PEZI|nr:uncharacterized protein RCC_11160 [Ramularia collo-cygni]CZT25428.1 uncharacterized protein RCC_11160 [Ramularia collo-cygni]
MSGYIDRYSRPLTYNTQALPSINDLAFGLRRCPTCSKLLADTESCADHELRSSAGLQLAEYQLPQDPFTKSAPMHRHTTSFPSPVLSTGDTSSDSEPMYTPNVSRAASPMNFSHISNATPLQKRRRTSKIATRRDSRRESFPPDGVCEQSKKFKKMEKEKACRSQQAAVLSRTEDYFRVYAGWERREQSGGNGNGAGLTANKINILRAMEVTVNFFVHRDRCAAIKEGPEALAEFERKMQQMLTEAPDEQPFDGTFLSGSEEPCTHKDPKSKECMTHGTADWRDCRVLQSRARFEEQQARWARENIPRDHQERWRHVHL